MTVRLLQNIYFGLKKILTEKRSLKLVPHRNYISLEKNKKFQFLSFPTISGTGPNGAIIHYKATKQTDRQLKKGDIYLVDSGGQYKLAQQM